MENQNYHHHRKFYTPHHFIFLPLLAIAQIVGIWKITSDTDHQLIWSLFSIIIFFIIYLTLMVRQHYALGNQDRIVRLEFKLRYFELFGKRSDEIENKLSFDQIASLRFAHDEEFKTLLKKTLEHNLSGKEIKKSITIWRADHHRI